MSIYRIKLNGNIYEMEIELVEEGKPRKEQSTATRAKPVEAKPAEQPRTTQQAKAVDKQSVEINANVVVSPMPGSIIEIVAKQGDRVEENEVVMILEAMKMENEVCAPRSGIIKKVFVNEGQVVSADAPLFEMED